MSDAGLVPRRCDQSARMRKIGIDSVELGRTRSSGSMIDICVVVPILVCAFAIIISPLLIYADAGPFHSGVLAVNDALQAAMAPRLENRLFWPAIAMITIVLVNVYTLKLALTSSNSPLPAVPGQYTSINDFVSDYGINDANYELVTVNKPAHE